MKFRAKNMRASSGTSAGCPMIDHGLARQKMLELHMIIYAVQWTYSIWLANLTMNFWHVFDIILYILFCSGFYLTKRSVTQQIF